MSEHNNHKGNYIEGRLFGFGLNVDIDEISHNIERGRIKKKAADGTLGDYVRGRQALDAYDKHGLSGLTRFCLPDSVTEEEDDD
jgi:hypothetical protein